MIKTPKQEALELVSKHFEIIAKAVNYQGLQKEGDKKFYAIEKIAKDCSLISVDDNLSVLRDILKESDNIYQSLKTPKKLCIDILNPKIKFLEEVKQEINKL